MGEISSFLKKTKYSVVYNFKIMNEKCKYLNYSGKGISISMDIPINQKKALISKFMNYLFKKYKVKINCSKDSIAKSDLFKNNSQYSRLNVIFLRLIRNKILILFFPTD